MTIQHNQANQNPSHTELDEHILVVKRTSLFPDGRNWHGLKNENWDTFVDIVMREKEFHPRSLMETDPRYKQIIPYLVFTNGGKYFIMQRRAQASEQRLKNKYSLGIGGHIRREDLLDDDIMTWADREFKEEISYSGSYKVTSLGILNDDSNPVGEVHIGCVLLLEGNSSSIDIKSEHKSGQLMPLEECELHYSSMEGWSQIVFNHLKTL